MQPGDHPVLQLRQLGAHRSPRRGEPVSCGVPWPKAALGEVGQLRLLDERGQAHPLQARVVERWRDGSIRWLLLDWQACTDRQYRLVTGGDEQPLSPAPAVRVSRAAEGRLEIDTGVCRFVLTSPGPFPFAGVETVHGRVIDTADSGLTFEPDSKERHVARVERLELECEGPIRATANVSGTLGRGDSALDFAARLSFFAGLATVRFRITLTNPRAAGHPNGCWGFGNSGSVWFRDVSLRLAVADAGEATIRYGISPEPGSDIAWCDGPVSLYQDSSGGERWNHSTHQNGTGLLPIRFRGYRFQRGPVDDAGLRATPVVALQSGQRHVAVVMQHFWQNFPKGVAARGNALELSLFPRAAAAPHELQGGEQKTHELHVSFARDAVTEWPLEWARAPTVANVAPSWYAACQAVPDLLAAADDPNQRYRKLVDSAIEGEHSFETKRELIDEYGWRHFGDIYADHEALYQPPGPPLVSHYNNQYDAVRGFAIQFMSSADLRWYTQMRELAQHVIDIDVYHTFEDKAAYNQGLFWHTDHYVDAGASNHRSFPALPGVAGGGPAPGHLYATGLLLHYLLTGDEQSRDTVLSFGRYVIACDDGSQSRYRWLDSGHTGHASESGLDRYHGPGRTSANAVCVLIDAARLSGERVFLDKAEQLISRCIHPNDDLEARRLWDTENRWYYTLFMKSLDYYLGFKAERGELDYQYGYARTSLLHYARWARENESPYLDKPECLEYPNETWAAQDMHKSEMFRAAAKLVSGDEHDRFMESARLFFDHSVGTLCGMATHGLARPTVLLLSFGYAQGYADNRGVVQRPEADTGRLEFGQPVSFVPQKRRAIRRLVQLAALGFVSSTLALAWLLANG